MWEPQSLYSKFANKQPVIFFGKNSVNGLFNYSANFILVIHGNSFSSLLKQTLETIYKKKCIKFVRVSSNEPTLSLVHSVLRNVGEFSPDLVIAVGGGSIIDLSKIVRLFIEYPSFNKLEHKVNCLPLRTKFVAIPSNIGSGAEASSAAVYFDEESKSKQMLVSHEFLPNVIVFDDTLLSTIDTERLMLSLMDVMAHSIEGYTSNLDNSMSDLYAEQALCIVGNELQKNSESFSLGRLQYASYLAGMVQNHCLVGVVHAIAHQMSQFGYSHTKAVGYLLSKSIKLNLLNENYQKKLLDLISNSNLKNIDSLLLLLDTIYEKSSLNDEECSKFYQVIKSQLLLCDINEPAGIEFIDNICNDKGGKGNLVRLERDYVKNYLMELCK